MSEKILKTHIYTAVDSARLGKEERNYGYLIMADGHERKRQGYNLIYGSRQRAELTAITQALERFDTTTPCEIEIHCEDRSIVHHATNDLKDKWQFKGWKNYRGKEIADRDRWERLYRRMENKFQKITFTKGKHKYSRFLREGMKFDFSI